MLQIINVSVALMIGSEILAATSQFRPLFEDARAGKSIDQAVAHLNMNKIDIAEETPVILGLLKDGNLAQARRAVGLILVVLSVRPLDEKAKQDARLLLPALVPHYDDPEPLKDDIGPTDSWRQLIIYLIGKSGATPTPELITRIKAELATPEARNNSVSMLAAVTLLRMRPVPSGVIEALLTKMNESAQTRLDVIAMFGSNHVYDVRVVQSIIQALEANTGSVVTDDRLIDERIADQQINELRRVAARALGELGPYAKDAVRPLRSIAESSDPNVESSARDVARQAIRLIEGQQ